MPEEKMQFQAEVGKVLDIVVNALYSDTDIFLRELISNASDACDKLRYAAITNPDMAKDAHEFKISLYPDKDAKTLTVEDNGIGMNREDLIQNLGIVGVVYRNKVDEINPKLTKIYLVVLIVAMILMIVAIR